MSVKFTCDLESAPTPLPHFWEHTVGSGHASLTLRADWQAQLRKAHDELGFRHVRFHAILSHPMDTLICVENEWLFSFFNTDQIFDFLLSIGMKPLVELSFMPLTLSSGGTRVFHYNANVTPPKDYEKWADLITKIIEHWIARYSIEEVRSWFFEVWNEPNQPQFWTGSQADYFKLFKHTFEAIKKVDKEIKVGGPVTSKNAWIEDFIEYCEKNDLSPDFISTHQYPTDAFGETGDNTVEQLAASRRSIMRERAQDVFRQAKGKPVFYTEWNSSSNPRDPLHDEPYAAAFCTKTILEADGLVECFSFWTFTDIFEENYFPSEPFQGGFGLLTINGISKPNYRAFELLHELGTEKLTVDGLHHRVDVWVVKKENSATVFLTNHALPKHQIKSENVKISMANSPDFTSAFVKRIDEAHANPKKIWVEMGKPEYLSAAQLEHLMQASRLIKEPIKCDYVDSMIEFEIIMPPHSVASATIEFKK